jgi:hypothetical protein
MPHKEKRISKTSQQYHRQFKWMIGSIALLIIMAVLPATARFVHAQDDRAVQEFEGSLDIDQSHFYMLPGLKVGQTLYVYANGTSGNLDPLVALVDADTDLDSLKEDFFSQVLAGADAGRDPLLVINEVADQLFLAWDDDSGTGYDAAFEYFIRRDGDYRLFITSPPSNPTFGEYRLQIGLNAPKVLEGSALATGDSIAYLDQEAKGSIYSVEEITGTLTSKNNSTFYYLKDVDPGKTFYAYIEPTSGNLVPTLMLKDFGGKIIRSGNYLGDRSTATLQYPFDEGGKNFILEVAGCQTCEDITSGDYRLLVGINAPQVHSGDAVSTDGSILRLPREVGIGVQLDQITDVDQKAENFTAVANIQMRWQDPRLAFSPDTCDCNLKTFTGNNFSKFIAITEDEWPEFSITNQQGNRWTQNKVALINPDGSSGYLERFTTTLQAPDFNFTRFPLDSQDFYIRITSLFPEEYFIFTDPEDLSSLGEQLGEEEWVITEFDTFVDTASSNTVNSRYNFHFQAKRNLTFYIVRFFIPLALIIIVSWITFFLKDYTRRIEVTTGNLLLFIAWNFSISDALPRLGYLTFMDSIIMTTFLISVVVVVFNVVLKRLEVSGRESRAFKIDNYTLWIYPLVYVIAFGLIVYLFLV